MKKVFSEFSQNSQKNGKGTQAQVFSSEFCEISKKIFFYRTPLVAASVTINFATINTLVAEPN